MIENLWPTKDSFSKFKNETLHPQSLYISHLPQIISFASLLHTINLSRSSLPIFLPPLLFLWCIFHRGAIVLSSSFLNRVPALGFCFVATMFIVWWSTVVFDFVCYHHCFLHSGHISCFTHINYLVSTLMHHVYSFGLNVNASMFRLDCMH